MRKICLILFILGLSLPATAQYKILDTTPKPQVKEVNPLDSLRDVYVGKHIIFFPRMKGRYSFNWDYYGNFYSQDPIELFKPYTAAEGTDRSRAKRMHEKGSWKLRKMLAEIRYKGEEVDDYKDIFDDGTKFESIHKAKGYFTPLEAIEGQSFLVNGIREYDRMNRSVLYGMEQGLAHNMPFSMEESVLVFDMHDGQGNPVYWMVRKRFGEDYSYPVFIAEETEAIKNEYAGKAFYLRKPKSIEPNRILIDISTNKSIAYYGRLSAKDIVLTGEEGKYCTPKLLLEDDEGKTYALILLRDLGINEYAKNNLYNRTPYEYYAAVSDLVPEDIILTERKAEEKRQQELALKRERDKEKERLARIQREEAAKKEEERLRNSYINKYGKRYADLIMNGRVAIGMTQKMCIDAWGEPETVNRMTTEYGTSEQWVYDLGTYLYFEGNKLTGIQN